MENHISTLEIQNFKSIRQAKLNPKRINVFIGEPNVGKSNVLEALSLYLAPNNDINDRVFKPYVRYEKLQNLFYDQDRKHKIKVKTNLATALFGFRLDSRNVYDLLIAKNHEIAQLPEETLDSISALLALNHQTVQSNETGNFDYFYSTIHQNEQLPHDSIRMTYYSSIKNYKFSPSISFKSPYTLFLRPPHGDNLYAIMESDFAVFEESAKFFRQRNLDLVLNTVDSSLDVQKRAGHRVYQMPYSLSADTLQRVIFHMAAIQTNKDSILLFEEPEAHCFPPYIDLMAQKMINSKTNQFFVATHSPYLLTPFIEQCGDDELAIYIVTYENFETKIRALTPEEIANFQEIGIDQIFFNMESFKTHD